MCVPVTADLCPCLHKGRGLHTMRVPVPKPGLYATRICASECVKNVHLCPGQYISVKPQPISRVLQDAGQALGGSSLRQMRARAPSSQRSRIVRPSVELSWFLRAKRNPHLLFHL